MTTKPKQKFQLRPKRRPKKEKEPVVISDAVISKNESGRYQSGLFKSEKTNSVIKYDSAFELAYMKILESDASVLDFIKEPFEIPYIDQRGTSRHYRPDLLVLYKNGDVSLQEVKPKSRIKDREVQVKAMAAVRYMKANYHGWGFRFVTEDDIFSSSKEYKALLSDLKGIENADSSV